MVEVHAGQASELQKNRKKLQQFYADSAKSGNKELSEEELGLLDSLVESDPQLATGLTLLKAKILASGVSLQNQTAGADSATAAKTDSN